MLEVLFSYPQVQEAQSVVATQSPKVQQQQQQDDQQQTESLEAQQQDQVQLYYPDAQAPATKMVAEDIKPALTPVYVEAEAPSTQMRAQDILKNDDLDYYYYEGDYSYVDGNRVD